MRNTGAPAPISGKEYTHPEYLVETDWLELHLGDADLRIYDCTAYPAPNPHPVLAKKYPIAPQSGRDHFAEVHIPGAGFMDVPGALSDKSSELPLMMPAEKQFSDAVAGCGIGDGTRVVLYSAANPMWAPRVWWMLRAAGFDNVCVLNGGLEKWVGEGRPVSSDPCTYPPGKFTAGSRAGAFVRKEDVLAAISNDDVRTIHALTPSVYDGTNDKLIFGRRGHIPNSVNVPSGTLHDPDTGAYLPAREMHQIFDTAQAGTADQIITYCGGGVNAAADAFALCLLGYENVAVYDGSMCEWGNDELLPIEMGEG